MNADIFNKLSLNAKVALRHASQISLQAGSADIDPVHIFIGIISTKKSLAVRILKSLGFTVQDLMNIFPEYTGITLDKKASQNPTKLYLSKESADILRESFRFANQMSHVYVGTEHILANLLLRKDLPFVKTLQKNGIKSQNYQEAMLNVATYPVGILAKPEQVEREVDFGQSPLASLGTDLVEAAKRGEFDPLYDRDKELDQLIKILSRRKKNNPIIVGEAGVGKTALVEGLAQKIAEGNVPTSLLNTKIFSLDVPSIIANSKLRGDVEEKVIAIIKEVSESSNTIVFIDEIHNILASGAPGGGIDIASILKPALLKDSFRCIGATTVEEYSQYFEEDNALARRFQHIMLEEPSEESTFKILERTKDLIEKHHHVAIQEGAIVSAVKLSDRYISDRYLPDKAIDLLDEAAAVRRMEVESKYKTASKLYIRLKDMSLLKRDAIRRGDMNTARNYRDEENVLKSEIKRIEARREETMESKSLK
jgi:ATP-dependent Clp protease ATP-binding subunit ClpC